MEPTPQPGGYGPPPTPIQPVYHQPPPPRPPRKPFRWARLFAVLAAMALVGSLLLNVLLLGVVGLGAGDGDVRVQEKFFSHQPAALEKIAILSIEGVILDGEGYANRQIEKALKDAKQGLLKAIVLRVNSPGGTIAGSDSIYHRLHELVEQTKIPVVVSMGGIAASGGYYVSMAVGDTPKSIYAEPSTWTGSIGVIIPHYDLSGLMKDWHVAEDSIVSAKLKGIGSFTKAMTDEERTILQELVNDAFGQFKGVVQAGRPKFQKDPAALDKLATGQVYSAEQAKRLGLVDEIGYLEDAVERAIELAKVDKDNIRVVKYKPELSLVDLLIGAQSRGKPAADVAALLELAVPRAYYLYYLGAPLLRSGP